MSFKENYCVIFKNSHAKGAKYIRFCKQYVTPHCFSASDRLKIWLLRWHLDSELFCNLEFLCGRFFFFSWRMSNLIGSMIGYLINLKRINNMLIFLSFFTQDCLFAKLMQKTPLCHCGNSKAHSKINSISWASPLYSSIHIRFLGRTFRTRKPLFS